MTDFPRPIATVDVVLFTLREPDGLMLLLPPREVPPFAGARALPGGFVRVGTDRDLDGTARRVLRDKGGVAAAWLEQLCTVSGPDRDPRGWSLSVAYLAVCPAERLAEAARAQLAPADALPPLAFDHDRIVARALERLRNKATYSSLPGFLLPDAFTLSELQAVYERVLGLELNRPAFRQKILDQGVVEPVAGAFRRGQNRPAQLYRLRREDALTLVREMRG